MYMNIAFIGLGKIGSGMADTLVAEGHQVVVWNRFRAKAEPLAAREAASAADLAADGKAVTAKGLDRHAARCVQHRRSEIGVWYKCG